MEALNIRKKSAQDTGWVKTILIENWGSEKIVLQGRILEPIELPGFIATMKEERVGLVTYLINPPICEIITLNSFLSGIGIGTELVNKVKKAALEKNCSEICVFTTNDNVDAFRFYQKVGFHLDKLIKNGVEPDREIKPEIPMISEHGIAIRDYLLFTMDIKQ